LSHLTSSEAILVNKTNNYMQTLRFQVLYDLKPYQTQMLRAHSNTVAFRRLHGNDYSVATKPNDMSELKSKLFSGPKQRYQPDQAKSVHNEQINSP
jgi:hypothetical protein